MIAMDFKNESIKIEIQEKSIRFKYYSLAIAIEIQRVQNWTFHVPERNNSFE